MKHVVSILFHRTPQPLTHSSSTRTYKNYGRAEWKQHRWQSDQLGGPWTYPNLSTKQVGIPDASGITVLYSFYLKNFLFKFPHSHHPIRNIPWYTYVLKSEDGFTVSYQARGNSSDPSQSGSQVSNVPLYYSQAMTWLRIIFSVNLSVLARTEILCFSVEGS